MTLRPSPFVLAATQHGTMIVNHLDYHGTPDARYGVGHQLLSTGAFDPAEVDAAKQLLTFRRQHFGNGVVAIDCGANIGVHSVEWAKHLHGWGDVIAIEAQERLFYALCGNLALNNCFNAKALYAAAGAEKGLIRIPVPDYTVPSSYGSLELREPLEKTRKVEYIGQSVSYGMEGTTLIQQVPLDALGLARVDFIKIDVEGMELDVLEGARGIIEAHHPVMIIETIKCSWDGLSILLDGYGYKVYQMGINVLAVHESDPTLGNVKLKG